MNEFKGAVILKNDKNPEAVKASEILKQKIEKHTEIFDLENAPNNALFFILGGDGTIIRYAKKLADKNPLIVGINFGHLGFLSPYEFNDVDRMIRNVFLNGKFSIVKRSFSAVKGEFGGFEFLNELVVQRDIRSHVIGIEIKIDESTVGNILCDGIMISTPTGSTAYNLSAGGPIIDPKADVLSVVPMMAHTFLKAPIVISSERTIKLEITPRDSEQYSAVLDGVILEEFNKKEIVEVVKSYKNVNFLCNDERDFFKIVNTKLGWGFQNGHGNGYA